MHRLADGVDAGLFREVDPRLLFVSIAGMSEYFAAARRLFEGEPEDELIERFTDHPSSC